MPQAHSEAAMVSPPDLFLRSPGATFTAAQWEQLSHDNVRYEIIDGVLYMSTSPTLFHQWIVQEVNAALRAQLVHTGIAFVFSAPVGLFMPGCDPVQPDLVVVRQEDRAILQGERIRGVPALLVEILSPSNAEYDLVTKRAAYARAGLPEYWIVRPATRDVLVCTDPDTAAGQYLQVAHVQPGAELVSPTLPFRIAIPAFFVGAQFTAP